MTELDYPLNKSQLNNAIETYLCSLTGNTPASNNFIKDAKISFDILAKEYIKEDISIPDKSSLIELFNSMDSKNSNDKILEECRVQYLFSTILDFFKNA